MSVASIYVMSSPVTAFDSSTVPVEALAAFLHGRDHDVLDLHPAVSTTIAGLGTLLPMSAREWLYQKGGRREAVAPDVLREFRTETASREIVEKYPARQYPAIVLGSSNGAVIHLCAALGIPFLPQNQLMLVHEPGLDPDQPRDIMQRGIPIAEALLANNPDLALHHMVDPCNDRYMSREALYFRTKRQVLGRAYEDFITQHLAPGGTLFTLETNLSWRVTRISERHVFQLGGLGGVTDEEYLEGSERIAQFLEAQDAPVRRWDAPQPNAEAPEAEWGFAPELLGDARRVAAKGGYRLRRIRIGTPEDLSPVIAALHRWWNRQRRPESESERLIMESFFLIDPWCVLRTGSVPFWTVFNGSPSADAMDRYLATSEAFDEIYLLAFSNGIRSPGLASAERWKAILARAKTRGQLLGVDLENYPKDFRVFFRYHRAMQEISVREEVPPRLDLGQLDTFLATVELPSAVQVVDDDAENDVRMRPIAATR
jgi:hypothetical protein